MRVEYEEINYLDRHGLCNVMKPLQLGLNTNYSDMSLQRKETKCCFVKISAITIPERHKPFKLKYDNQKIGINKINCNLPNLAGRRNNHSAMLIKITFVLLYKMNYQGTM